MLGAAVVREAVGGGGGGVGGIGEDERRELLFEQVACFIRVGREWEEEWSVFGHGRMVS